MQKNCQHGIPSKISEINRIIFENLLITIVLYHLDVPNGS